MWITSCIMCLFGFEWLVRQYNREWEQKDVVVRMRHRNWTGIGTVSVSLSSFSWFQRTTHMSKVSVSAWQPIGTRHPLFLSSRDHAVFSDSRWSSAVLGKRTNVPQSAQSNCARVCPFIAHGFSGDAGATLRVLCADSWSGDVWPDCLCGAT